MKLSIPGWRIPAVLFLAMCQLITSCEKQLPKKQVRVSGVEIDRSEVTLLLINDTVRLKALVLPEDATNRDVEWSSGNNAVASVDSCGLVTASGVGNYIITVTTDDSGYTATCKITVPVQPAEVIDVTSITLEQSLTLLIGESRVLNFTISPEDATNKNVSWSSSNQDIVYVDNSGKITARNADIANITVATEDGGLQSTCKIIVKMWQ